MLLVSMRLKWMAVAAKIDGSSSRRLLSRASVWPVGAGCGMSDSPAAAYPGAAPCPLTDTCKGWAQVASTRLLVQG